MKWKTVNIFISSTFNDMHAERDYIRKFLIPRLNNALAKYRICIQATDLRWGISTTDISEEEREAKVLHICLNTIKNTKPYFIALLGDRYGWIPPFERIKKISHTLDYDQQAIMAHIHEEVSVTEMEILLGAIGSPQLLDHSYFCFRQADSFHEIPTELQPTYFDFPDSKSHRKLEALKKRIRDTCKTANQEFRIITYSPSWNHDRQQFEQLDQLGDNLFNAIVSDIQKDIVKSNPQNKISPFMEDGTEALEDFINLNVMNFMGRKELLSNLIEFVFSRYTVQGALRRSNCRFLTGFSGCGKSYVFSALCKELEPYVEPKNLVLLTHAAGVTRQSASSRDMLYRWCRRLLNILNDTTPLDPKDSASQFQSLILRVQAQGFFPVILIDSLDSFTSDPDNVLRQFNFIPYSVPTICTAISGYADSIVKINPACEIREIDCFSREDALALISYRLKSNVKELTSGQIDSILSKIDISGRPAYESPLWLQLVLSILMELGSEDFHSIHRQQFDGEDRKIEEYLNVIINKLPADAGSLFAYFIDLTSKYFNRQLTNKALSLIALTIDGVDEATLMQLVGDDWDTLEFTSIRYWMKDFIRRDGQTLKWKFTHNILRSIVRNLNTVLIDQMTNNLLEHIEKNVRENPEDLNDYIYMLIDGKHYEKLYEFISKKNTYNRYNTAKVLTDIVSYFDKEQFLIFFATMIEKHHLANTICRFMDTVVTEFIKQERKKHSVDNVDFIIRLSLLLPNSYSDKEIYSCNPDVLCGYFDSLSIPLSVYRDFELTESYIVIFEKIYEVFVTNKRLHGSKFLCFDLIYSLFLPWQLYISFFCKVTLINKDNIVFFTKELERMFDALEWYVDNISSFVDMDNLEDYHTIGHEIADCVKSLFFKDESPLSINNLDNYMQRLQAMLLKTYSEDYQEEFIEDATMLIEKYIDIHKPQYNTYVKHFETTPLMRFLNHPGYDELHIEIEEEAKARLDRLYAQNNLKIDHNTGVVSLLNPELKTIEGDRIYENSLNEEDWEEIDIQELLRPGWMRPKTDEPTYEIVRQKRSSLDKVLTDLNTRNSYFVDSRDRYSEEYYDMIEAYRNLTFSIVEDMIALGEKAEAFTLLKNAEILFCRPIVEIDARYGIWVETAKNIKSLSDFYEYINEEKRAITFLEAVVDSIWQSYYHHISGEGHKWLLNCLDSLYYTYNLTDKRIQLREKRFHIASTSHCDHLADDHYYKYSELCYVRFAYDDLFNSYYENGDIEKCAVLLNAWKEVCNATYMDGQRQTEAKEEYELIERRFNMIT